MKKLQIEITNACNFACEFCPQPSMKRPIENMDLPTFQAIIDDVVVHNIAPRIEMHVLGEPLLHPDVVKAVQYASSLGLGVDLTTNGSLLDAEYLRQLSQAGLGLLSISLVGTRPDEYSYRHAKQDIETYYARILEAVRIARSPEYDIEVRIRIMSTWSKFLFSVPLNFQINHKPDDHRKTLVALISDLLRVTGNIPDINKIKSSVHGLPLRRSLIIELDPGLSIFLYTFADWGNAFTDKDVHPAYFGSCPCAITTASVLSNGDVVPCVCDYQGEACLGNVRNEPLSGILKGDRARWIEDGFKRNRVLHPLCRRCLGSSSKIKTLCKGLLLSAFLRFNDPLAVKRIKLFNEMPLPSQYPVSRETQPHVLRQHRECDTGYDAALGLDLGTSTIKAVLRCSDGREQLIVRAYKGRLKETLQDIVRELEQPTAIAITGTSGKAVAEQLGLHFVDTTVAKLANLEPGNSFRHIIEIGGGTASIMNLDEKGQFKDFRRNGICAAGTGSFLDEQAARLGIQCDDDTHMPVDTDPPNIAARCAVFAKSDIIHHQQKGYSLHELWSGLCRGIASSVVSTLFQGRAPQGPVLFVGGVAKNREVLRWLEKELEIKIVVPNEPQMYGARGASFLARPVLEDPRWQKLNIDVSKRTSLPRPRLDLQRSSIPHGNQGTEIMVNDTELRIHQPVKTPVVLGIDIGSTSTKAVVLDLEGRLLADLYRRTNGDPIRATQTILAVLTENLSVNSRSVRALGVTGSGRQMIGSLFGADAVVNEITAHVTSALQINPSVTAIIEIGGQDAKFISLRNGRPVDFNMNYLCAGGTGSFIEEQARRLGVDVREVGTLALGSCPPVSSDRCTVFMAQDVDAMIHLGYSLPEVLGAVLHSVVQNYLKQVVQHRRLETGTICFMGATARNIGLVAAFEQRLDAPIIVSPWCHVMGAMGVAHIARQKINEAGLPSRFVGFAQAGEPINLKQEICDKCGNNCTITRLCMDGTSGDNSPSWGYLCGRDPDSSRFEQMAGFEAFRQRNKLWAFGGEDKNILSKGLQIGIPRALSSHNHLPFWRCFFNALGASVKLSPATDDGTRDRAHTYSSSTFCYPVCIAFGHVAGLLLDHDVDLVFLPDTHKTFPHDNGAKQAVYCPFITAFGSIARTVAADLDLEARLQTPVVELQWSAEKAALKLLGTVGKVLHVGQGKLRHAWSLAQAALKDFEAQSRDLGRKVLADIETGNKQGLVVIGCSYNCFDEGLNLHIPEKLARLGFIVLPVDILPLEDVPVDKRLPNLYWKQGRHMIQAASFVAEHPQLHAVILTSHACGPDAYLKSYIEMIMGDKPMLILELDGHGSDTGYLTRLEAFSDIILRDRTSEPLSIDLKKKITPMGTHLFPSMGWVKNPGLLWIPSMHPYGSEFTAAALRRRGRHAYVLPPETKLNFTNGMHFCQGGECLPARTIIGSFLEVLKSSDPSLSHSLFIPEADNGPCRYGQYQSFFRLVLDKAGYPNTRVEGMKDSEGHDDPQMSRWFYDAAIFSDLLFKARCRLRPYDSDRPSFDRLMDNFVAMMARTIESGEEIKRVLVEIVRQLRARPMQNCRKPLVGIVGELYLRYNTFTSNGLIELIEEEGGEAWVEPLAPWFQYTVWQDIQRARARRETVKRRLRLAVNQAYMSHREHVLTKVMSPILEDRPEPSFQSILNAGEAAFPRHYYGEPITTVGRAIEFVRFGVDLVLNVAPLHCMSGTMTAGVFRRLESREPTPIITLFFDGETDVSHQVRAHMAVLKASCVKSISK